MRFIELPPHSLPTKAAPAFAKVHHRALEGKKKREQAAQREG
jgi:hypothetical protein